MRTTKIELTQTNARLATENAALRAELAKLTAQLEAERVAHRNVTGVASALNTMSTSTRRFGLFISGQQCVSYRDFTTANEAAKRIKTQRPDLAVAIHSL